MAMEQTDQTTVQESTTPVESSAPAVETASGYEDLLVAFGGGRDGGVEVSGEGVEVTPDPEPQATPEPETPSTPQVDVESRAIELANRRIEEYNRAQTDAQRQAAIQKMDPYQYGVFMRQQEAAQQYASQVREQVATEFYKEGYVNVVSSIPELKSLTPEESQKLNPGNFQTYGEAISAVLDFVTEKRASKLAQAQTKAEMEAFKVQYAKENRGREPRVLVNNGGLTASGGVPDVMSVSGEELLRLGFSSRK